jgi:2-dehydro-3-deoxygluconokinase
MAKIVTMGEIMLRLSTNNYKRFVQSENFDVNYGGGEANVAVSLANYGHDVYYVTKLPDNEIAQSAINSMRKVGVNTNYIVRGGNRIGIYYLETGAAMRPSKVIYDRAGSSICEAECEDFDFDKIFEGATWFHWTGITPAISKKAQKLIECALISAKKHNEPFQLILTSVKNYGLKKKRAHA